MHFSIAVQITQFTSEDVLKHFGAKIKANRKSKHIEKSTHLLVLFSFYCFITEHNNNKMQIQCIIIFALLYTEMQSDQHCFFHNGNAFCNIMLSH